MSDVLEMSKPSNETDLDREIEAFSGKVLRGDSVNRSEFDRLVSKRTEGLVKLPSIRSQQYQTRRKSA